MVGNGINQQVSIFVCYWNR